MPCIRSDNGQAVPGAKGSCPIGSAWSDTADNDQFDWQDVGTFAKRRYFGDDGKFRTGTAAMDAATGMIFIPGVGWVAGGAMKAGAKGIPWLISRLFGKKVAEKAAVTATKTVPKTGAPFVNKATPINRTYPINKPVPRLNNAKPFRAAPTTQVTQTIKPAVAAHRTFAPFKSLAVAGIGAQAVDRFAPFTEAGIEAKKVRDAKAAALATQTQEDETVKIDAAAIEAAKVQTEKDRVAGLSFTDKMKEPGYWDETDSTGLNRIEKLGQLIAYYGQTPKQRAKDTSPADRWAEMTTKNLATAAALEKSRLNLKGSYSNVGNKTLEEFVEFQVQEEYGDKWYTFGAKEDEVAAITAEIMGYMIQLSKQNPAMMQGELYMLAKQEYEKAKEEREGS